MTWALVHARAGAAGVRVWDPFIFLVPDPITV